MAKGSAVIGVLALILGAGGFGLGGFAWFSVSNIETQVDNFSDQNSWYKYNETAFITDPYNNFLTYSELIVEFELGPGESVYFSFTCRAHVEPIPSFWSQILVFFKVDGLFQTEPSAVVGMYNGAFMQNYMIHLQAVRSDLSSGDHNVTVVVWGDSTGNYIYKSTLFVQKVNT